MKASPFLAFMPLVAITAPAYAVEYFNVSEAQQALFAEADRFDEHFLQFDDEQKEAIESLSDVRQRWKKQKVWKAYKGDQVIGWFIIDKVIGKHEFITYATALSVTGEITGIEIMDYRESYGDQVRMAPWRAQFNGKNDINQVRFNDNIANISGATLSCRNVTNGVKRMLAIHSLSLKTS